MKHLRRLALVPLAALAGSLFAEESPDAAILGGLRIGSLQDLAASSGAFAEKIQPGSGANTAQLTFGATAFGLALDQELLALVIDPQKSGQPYALVLPVLDPEQFKANPALKFQAAASSPDRYQLTLPNGQTMFAAFVGKRLVASPLEAGLDAVLRAIRADQDIRGLRAAGGQLALSLDTGRLYAAYKPMVDLMLMGMRGQFANGQTDKNPQAPNPADVLGSMLGSLADIQDYSLRIAIEAEHLDLRTALVAKPGTQTAALLSAGRGPAVALPAAYDESSAVFGTVSARPTPEFWTAYNQFTSRMLSTMGSPGSEAAGQTIAKTMNEFAAIWDGTGSFAMFPPGKAGFNGGGKIGVNDREKALALIRAMPELQKNMAAINEAQGLVTDVAFGAEQKHGDAILIDATQTMRAAKPEMEEALKQMQKLGLEKITSTYGFTATQLVSVMGENSNAKAKRLLDTSGSASAKITPAAYGLPAESTAFVAISVPRYLGWIARVGDSMPFSYDAGAAPQQPGLAMTADIVDGRADIRVRLETSEIVAVKNAFAKPATASAAPAAAVE